MAVHWHGMAVAVVVACLAMAPLGRAALTCIAVTDPSDNATSPAVGSLRWAVGEATLPDACVDLPLDVSLVAPLTIATPMALLGGPGVSFSTITALSPTACLTVTADSVFLSQIALTNFTSEAALRIDGNNFTGIDLQACNSTVGFMVHGAQATLEYVRAIGNSGNGIELHGSSARLVVYAVGNGESGVAVSAGVFATMIEESYLSGNMADGLTDAGTNTRVTRCVVGTTPDGMSAMGNINSGLQLVGRGTLIEDTIVSGNAAEQASFFGCTDTVMRNCTIGLDITGSAVLSAYSDGILLRRSLNTTIERCFVGGASRFGVFLGGTRSFVKDSVIGLDARQMQAMPNGVGIQFGPTLTEGAAIGNTVAGSTGIGISLGRAKNVQVLSNRVGIGALASAGLGNGAEGIKADAGGSGHRISGNVVVSSSLDGVSVSAPFVTIEDNVIGLDPMTAAVLPNRGQNIRFDRGSDHSLALQNSVLGGIGFIWCESDVRNLTLDGNSILSLPNPGSNPGTGGITIYSSDVMVRDNVLINVLGTGFQLRGRNVTLEANFIGTNRAGQTFQSFPDALVEVEAGPEPESGIVLRHNYLVGGASAGVNLISGSNVVVTDNIFGSTPSDTVMGNAVGIVSQAGCTALTAANNVIVGSRSDALVLRCPSSIIEANALLNNGGAGLVVFPAATGSRITSNTISENGGAGVSFASPVQVLLRLNRVFNNSGPAIELLADTPAVPVPEPPRFTRVNATSVAGTLAPAEGDTWLVDVYTSKTCGLDASGELGQLLCSATVAGRPSLTPFQCSLPEALDPAGVKLTAMATRLSIGASSPLSACVSYAASDVACEVCDCLPNNVVKCDRQGLTEVPRNVPAATQLLDLSLNSISVLSLERLGNLPNLVTLLARGNKIADIQPPDLLMRFPALKEIDLQDNRLPEVPPVCNLADRLLFGGNRITTLPTFTLPDLKLLSLSNNLIGGELRVRDLAGMSGLILLALDGNQLAAAILDDLSGFPDLQSIDISNQDPKPLNDAVFGKAPLLPVVRTYSPNCPAGYGLAFNQPDLNLYECIRCPLGTFKSAGREDLSTCIRCEPGTTDEDRDQATPCVQCPAGTASPVGRFGPCAVCQALGLVDDDNDPRTACVAAAVSRNSQGSENIWLPIVISTGIVVLAVLLLLWALRHRPVHGVNFQILIKALQNDEEGADFRVPKELPRSQYTLWRHIGEGNWSEVQAAIVKKTGSIAAIKRLKPEYRSSNETLLREALLMAQLDHPHVVALCGVCTLDLDVWVVMGYCRHGSLLTTLQQVQRLATATYIRLCKDTADGMAYLESVGVVHRDVSARNVLLDDGYRCMIGDFGSAHHRRFYHPPLDKVAIRWAAPELLNEEFSHKSDCWSLAVTFMEIFGGGQVPFREYDDRTFLAAMEAEELRLNLRDVPESTRSLVESCLRFEPMERPTLAEVADSLAQLMVAESVILEDTVNELRAVGGDHLPDRSIDYQQIEALRRLPPSPDPRGDLLLTNLDDSPYAGVRSQPLLPMERGSRGFLRAPDGLDDANPGYLSSRASASRGSMTTAYIGVASLGRRPAHSPSQVHLDVPIDVDEPEHGDSSCSTV